MKRGYLFSKVSDDDNGDLKEALTSEGKKRSYLPVIVAYTFYAITYTIVIPALPGLALNLCNGNSTHSSYIYGMANFARYISEFFAAPLLGTGTDIIGRKPMLLGSFIICGVEYALLAFFPSIPMLFATRIMAGLFDCSNPTVYTIITDLAFYNGDNVTTKFGLITALLGIGFVVGPLLGGVLCDISISLCFLISTVITGVGAVITLFFLEETLPLVTMDRRRTVSMFVSVAPSEAMDGTETGEGVGAGAGAGVGAALVSDPIDTIPQRPPSTISSTFPPPPTLPRNDTTISALTSHSAHSHTHDRLDDDVGGSGGGGLGGSGGPSRTVKRFQDVTWEELNPIPALITHMKNPIMRDLTIPLFVSSLNVGSGSIWVIYQVHKYHSSSTEVGIYMAFYGDVMTHAARTDWYCRWYSRDSVDDCCDCSPRLKMPSTRMHSCGNPYHSSWTPFSTVPVAVHRCHRRRRCGHPRIVRGHHHCRHCHRTMRHVDASWDVSDNTYHRKYTPNTPPRSHTRTMPRQTTDTTPPDAFSTTPQTTPQRSTNQTPSPTCVSNITPPVNSPVPSHHRVTTTILSLSRLSTRGHRPCQW